MEAGEQRYESPKVDTLPAGELTWAMMGPRPVYLGGGITRRSLIFYVVMNGIHDVGTKHGISESRDETP